MRMKESKFGAPEGIYDGAKFLGVIPFKREGAPKVGRDGKPMGEAVEWQWELTEGEHKGQIVGRLTSAEPTTKNACGALLRGVMGREIGSDEDVDPNVMRGRTYRVVIEPGKENPDRTQVTKAFLVGSQPAAATPPPAPPRQPAPPAGVPVQFPGGAPATFNPQPPAAPAPAQRAPDPEPQYWCHDGREQRQMTGTEIRELLKSGLVRPEEIQVQSLDGSTGWKPLSHFGLDIPF